MARMGTAGVSGRRSYSVKRGGERNRSERHPAATSPAGLDRRSDLVKRTYLASLLGALVGAAFLAAQPPMPRTVPPGTPVTITVTPSAPAAPAVTITLNGRHGHVTPYRKGCTHTGAGNIDVAQPSADVVIITMTGVAVATAHPFCHSIASLDFDLEQCFDIVFEKSDVKAAKLTLEG